jgi:hypothetical protein
MRILKQAGQDVPPGDRRKMHGSVHERKLQVSNGKLNRAGEKPGNRIIGPNDNQRHRQPGRRRPGG